MIEIVTQIKLVTLIICIIAYIGMIYAWTAYRNKSECSE